MAADLLEPEDNDADDTKARRTPMSPDVLALTRIERTLDQLEPEVRARIVAWIASKHK